ncbi:MAG: GNAT family N-acetyltransferase [Chloroflexota bacterium]|nr:GNAT family N-acetyltransferase [Chloroflexota bacterium]MDQ5864689.1 GNAT family N-acetyltransferase [Chloroflexota bacterium]
MSNPQSESADPKYLSLIPIFDELRGERLVVRPYREEDAKGLQEAIAESREHLRPWMHFADKHQTVEESRDWINQQRAEVILRKSINCGLFEIGSGRYLGGLGIMPRDWDIRYFEIGYWLRKSAEGHGYMTEAVRLVVGYLFEELGAQRVEILCDERNEHSANVARRLGFVQEGRMRNDVRDPSGSIRNTLIFSRIPGDPR